MEWSFQHGEYILASDKEASSAKSPTTTINHSIGSDNHYRLKVLLFIAILCLPIDALGLGAFMLPPDIASQYSLSTSTSLPFPSATQSNSNTQKTLLDGWSIDRGKIQQGSANIEFVSDPFPNYHLPSSSSFPSPSGPVLRVTYTKGGYSSTGSGTQFYSLWNSTGDAFRTALLTYEVAFASSFNWVQGGKLPGFRGGQDPNTCDGGSKSDGTCFSARIMWRKLGDGEGTYNSRCLAPFLNLDRFISSLRIYPESEPSV